VASLVLLNGIEDILQTSFSILSVDEKDIKVSSCTAAERRQNGTSRDDYPWNVLMNVLYTSSNARYAE
jgi:hypothetical protein